MNSTNLAPGWGVYGRIVGMVALWGASYSWAKIVSTALPPISAACLRFFLAAGALLLWLHHLRRVRNLLKLNWRQWGGLALAALSGIVIYTICFMYGMRYIDASRAAVLFALNPVLTLFMAALIFRERLNGLILGGMLLAVVGSIVVVSQGQPLSLLRGGLGPGEALVAGCIVCWTTYTLIGRKILGGMDALTTTVATLLLGALLLLPVSLLVEGTAGYGALLEASLPVWAALLALTWGSTSLAYAWYFEGVRLLGAGTTAGYLTLEPLAGVLLAYLFLGEHLHPSLIGGGLVAMLGMLLMYLGRRLH